MKKFLAFALALMLAIPAMAFADGRDADITALGTATVTAEPDMVTVTANASVSAKTVGEAQEAMNKIIASVTDKLIQLGVAQDDIVTSNYSYYPTYNYDADTPTVSGYQANHTLSITCRDVDMLDSVVGVVTDSGMSEIYNVSYDVSNRSELYKQALALAIDAAAKKADVMAGAAGMTVSGLESISENGGYDAGYAVNSVADSGAVSMRAESAETGIRSGSISVTASVTAVYEAEAK